MAKFEPCFEKTMELEGGYVLHNVPGDRGGQTYAGIARNSWSKWEGWVRVDAKQFDTWLQYLVKDFYKENFWDKLKGDDIGSQEIAFCIYDFAVNAGIQTAVKLIQKITGMEQDGAFGPKTFKALSAFAGNEQVFVLRYNLEKCFRYKDICLNDSRRKGDQIESNLKFICGWLNRVQKGLA